MAFQVLTIGGDEDTIIAATPPTLCIAIAFLINEQSPLATVTAYPESGGDGSVLLQ